MAALSSHRYICNDYASSQWNYPNENAKKIRFAQQTLPDLRFAI
jgi:hypothetical protein